MAGEATYRPNAAGLNAMATGPDMAGAVQAVLRQLEAAAVQASPRSTEAERAYFAQRYGASSPQRYADSFHAREEVVTRKGRPRVEGRLVNDSPQAAAVEFGNARVRRPLHVMARAAAQVGAPL